jgi:hypothetical protein
MTGAWQAEGARKGITTDVAVDPSAFEMLRPTTYVPLEKYPWDDVAPLAVDMSPNDQARWSQASKAGSGVAATNRTISPTSQTI